MIRKLAALGLASALALTAVTAATTDTASARVRVGVTLGFGWPGYAPYGYYPYRPYYHPYRYAYYPRPYYRPYAYVGGSTHVQRCLARYRTYNPATDTYFVRPGVPARCRL